MIHIFYFWQGEWQFYKTGTYLEFVELQKHKTIDFEYLGW